MSYKQQTLYCFTHESRTGTSAEATADVRMQKYEEKVERQNIAAFLPEKNIFTLDAKALEREDVMGLLFLAGGQSWKIF